MHPFINKLLCFMLAIALVVALAVPVFAEEYNGVELPDVNTVWMEDTYPYYVIRQIGTDYYLLLSSHSTYVSNGNLHADSKWVSYYVSGDKWAKAAEGSNGLNPEPVAGKVYIWANHNIVNKDDNSYFFAPLAIECDGSTCPATDANHDNICDDCGKVLTMSLRSTLLDFAKSHAATFTDHPYFAVLEHPTEDNKYNVYLSAAAMFANPTDYETAYGTNLLWCQVFEDANGTFSYTGELSVSKFSGTLVYANHDIKNFQEPPLAVIIQGVTGEALEVEIPSLMTEIRIILLCGVGCLALLIALPLLSKKLRPYLTR